ncbi:oxygenase MpaB family protein [Streptomyces sp. NPDC002403]
MVSIRPNQRLNRDAMTADGSECEFRRLFTGPTGKEYRAGLALGMVQVFTVPRFAAALVRSGDYFRDPVGRHKVTIDLLETVVREGPDSRAAREAIRRMNRAHRHAGLTAEDLRYGLATFVVSPRRWASEVGQRPWTDAETSAAISFYQRLGALMGVQDLPPSYDGQLSLLDESARRMQRYSMASERLAMAALSQFTGKTPTVLRKFTQAAFAGLLDDRTRLAIGLPQASAATRAAVRTGLRLRRAVIELRQHGVRRTEAV